MISLIKNSQNLISKIKDNPKRYLFDEIDFSQRLIGITGQRGIGKTTLILQYLKSQKKESVIYLSADDIYFVDNFLKTTVEKFYYDYDVKIICIDEIHKYKNWNQEIKNLYDLLPDVKIIFSGSSTLDIIQSAYDLSRRALIYRLNGLSFREFIYFEKGIKIEPLSLKNIFQDFKKISLKISSQIENIIDIFRDYYNYGYYPYFLEGGIETYYKKLENALKKTVYEDISNCYKLKTENLYLFKKILNFLSTIPPGEISINKLSNSLGVAFETIEHYLNILKEIGLVNFVINNQTGHHLIRKNAKIFLENTNILNLINKKTGQDVNLGTVRELFFINQLKNKNIDIFNIHKNGDFLIKQKDKSYLVEIGGRAKNFSQIKNKTNSFLVLDDIAIGEDRQIPLYLFGFLY